MPETLDTLVCDGFVECSLCDGNAGLGVQGTCNVDAHIIV